MIIDLFTLYTRLFLYFYGKIFIHSMNRYIYKCISCYTIHMHTYILRYVHINVFFPVSVNHVRSNMPYPSPLQLSIPFIIAQRNTNI